MGFYPEWEETPEDSDGLAFLGDRRDIPSAPFRIVEAVFVQLWDDVDCGWVPGFCNRGCCQVGL